MAAPGFPLPDVPNSQFGRVADLYSDEVAALVVFDLLWKRGT